MKLCDSLRWRFIALEEKCLFKGRSTLKEHELPKVEVNTFLRGKGSSPSEGNVRRRLFKGEGPTMIGFKAQG